MNNCIVYFNTARDGADNYLCYAYFNYCCTTPQPESWQGIGNITLNPQLASAVCLSADSPCRGAGNGGYATGTDIDGEPWGVPPSIGCDEFHAGAIKGPLSVGIEAPYSSVTVGYPMALTALIEGRCSASVWEFGDGVIVSNRPFATHAWAAPGDYAVVARAYNESHPEGVSATVTVHVVVQPVHYVAAGSTNPLPPYTSWATAAANIQDAVDAATVPGALVLVTDGTYAYGGRTAQPDDNTNRVAVDRPLILQSVNGPQFTVILGRPARWNTNLDSAIRCVYLANGASLSGFVLTNGGAWIGGGVRCESEAAVVSNCVIVGNSARDGGGASGGTLNYCTLRGNSASDYGGGANGGALNFCTLDANSTKGGNNPYGGGACNATLRNCTLTANSALSGGGTMFSRLVNCIVTANSVEGGGGGAYEGTLNNCTLTGNSANGGGGGVYNSTLNNCIVYFNTAANGANYYLAEWVSASSEYCCTTPLPTNGVGNITNAPLFVDYAGGNLRLQSNSPCINAGLNANAPGPTDLDGKPRIVSGTVDIGAYEFQGPGSVISYAWLQQYGLPTDGSTDFTDPDADGHNTWQEWRCLTDPTNALSVLRLLSASPGGTNVTVSWQSVLGVSYFLERSTNLSATPRFTPLATNLPGQPGTTSFTDTNAARLAPLFYRVGVP